MPLSALSPEDDARHAHGPHAFWNESFYFNFFDPTGGLGGVTRIGYSPAKSVTDGLLALYLPNRTALVVRTVEAWKPAHAGDFAPQAGTLRYRCLEPHQRWELRYEGDAWLIEDPRDCEWLTALGLVARPRRAVSFTLEFRAFHPVYVFPSLPQRRLPLGEALRGPGGTGGLVARLKLIPPRLASAVAMRDNAHLEQAGRVFGQVELDGVAQTFEGTGMRDRSWGVRDWRVATRWRWINAQFGEALAFNAFRIHLVGYDAWGGYVWHEGKLMSLADWSRVERDGHAVLTLRPEGGESLEIRVETQMALPFTIQEPGFSTVLDEEIARFRWRGWETRGVNELMQRKFP